MKKYMIFVTALLLTQAPLHAEGWFKTNWNKFKNKLESIFDKNKKSSSKADTKLKPAHEQAYELQQEVLKLEASANGLQQKILRAKFELKQMEEKHEAHHRDIKEKQSQIKALHQPEMIHHAIEHKSHELNHKHEDHKQNHAEHKAPTMLHTKKAPSKPNKK